jgi:xanthine dehydrogenase accessory factor
MQEVIADVDRWLAAGETAIALATVIEAWGSAPRRAGAKMAFTAGGAAIAGSVSGGCVEGAVIAAGDEVLADGRPRLLHFGVADETAWGVGLACGGEIDVYVERLDPATYALARAWTLAGAPGALVTVVGGPEELLGRRLAVTAGSVSGSLGMGLDVVAVELARQAHRPLRHTLPGGIELFIDALRPPPTLAIVGGAHIAVALAQMARLLGYRTVVIDPRRAFGSAARFPEVDQLIQSWPDKAFAELPIGAATAVITLSHDPKIDDPALRAALQSDAFYVGALGSRRTHAQRRARLAAAGFSDEQLDRIHAPIGLDIAADNPEEIALAIMAEVVKVYRGSVSQ